jgi:phosphohistidine phosphatase SixA
MSNSPIPFQRPYLRDLARRLAERGLAEVEQALALLARTLTSHALVTDEGRAVLEVIQRYSRSWRWLLE